MTSRDFCFGLQGFLELQEVALVFKHEIDPSMGAAPHQAALDKIHKEPWVNPLGDKTVARC